MKKKKKHIVKVMVLSVLVSLGTVQCNKSDIENGSSNNTGNTGENIVIPTVETAEVANITQTSVTSGGNVTSDGGAEVTARGVCWGKGEYPTLNGSHTNDGTGTGSFSSSITGLTAGTTYYIRAFATNSAGTRYGEQKCFTTAEEEGGNDSVVLNVSPLELCFEPEGSSASCSIQSNSPWAASCADSWCSVNPSSGIGDGTLMVSVSNNENPSNRTTTIQISAGDKTCSISITQNKFDGIIIEGHVAIDLGLTSGTKWADCNVGADSYSDYGGYYRFDEVTDDWGGRWKRPTKTQLEELKNQCEWKWTSRDDHNGYLATGPNGNSIFLPAAGTHFNTGMENVGKNGSYRSSTSINTNFAYGMGFYSGSISPSLSQSKNTGLSVRLVAN